MKYFKHILDIFLHFVFILDTFEDLGNGVDTPEKDAYLPKMLCFNIS